MKIFLLITLILCVKPATSAVITLTAINDKPGEVGTVEFKFLKNAVTQERKTNTISHPEQLWFGKAKPLKSAEVSKLQASIEEVSRKLKLVDNFLKNESGEGRNEFLKGAPHGLRFMVNDQVVLPDTKAYEDVRPIFEKLASLDWTVENGIVLTGSPLEVNRVKSGKKTSVGKTEPLLCRSEDKLRICRASGFGPIVLE